MAFDIEMIKSVYSKIKNRVNKARELTGKPLTASEKDSVFPSLGWKSRKGLFKR